MRAVVLSACLLAAVALPGWAQQHAMFLSPGVKFGYSFDGNGGFTIGPEVSLTYYEDDKPVIPGVVIGWYSTPGRNILAVGAQVTGPATVGFGLAHAWLFEHGNVSTGLKCELFGLVGVIPYYAHTFRYSGDESIEELGAYIKVPLALGKGLHYNRN